MNYFQSQSLPADAGAVAAWDSEIARATEVPSLARLIAERGAELYPEFARRYAEVRALPRNARRALQKRLAASGELTAIPAEWRRRLAYSIAGAALLLVLSDGPLQAATINVGPTCSLTNAIVSANTDSPVGGCTTGSGPDTIVLPPASKIGLTSVYPGPYSATGLPTVTTQITITGNGSSISRKKGPLMRLMAVSSAGDLTLNNLTLSGGNSTPAYGGGAIYNAGILEVNGCTITGNFSGAGAISNGGTATISGTTFLKNTGYYGGAVYNFGTMQLQNNTIITSNRAFYSGGGVFNHDNGEVEIDGSTISKNTAYLGGGIANYNGTVTVDPTLITGNKAAGGGGIFTYGGSVYVDGSTLTSNSAKVVGGGIFSIYTTLNVFNSSAITANKGGQAGGGVLNCGVFTLTNSTISGNSAKLVGGGVANVYGTFYGPYKNYTCNTSFTDNGTVYGNKAKPPYQNFYP